ncbi:dTDP-4-dehydrorhamnose 3,5-epimerase [Legionella micdadei]|uniref:dTDP-4-dehydrorhamnose 3,5-epimerase n=2 Tax=Legionella micdadei TaxID=451 RepID=A0A098GHF6_LEGMI|nr:dTDP-4-dehydrorhamnose 3,5-epimerase [Legionella micdadei]KTD29256.1 dTDP-6-deoxy-D-glucose-3,5-epimerase RmlC [Legionella micdadei]CEG61412.1 dTDP-4-deoxyrhamnose-3,5-epimerase (modular protein) [Legionella micdadei]SCY40316.1 dTDP-4-dehydrorhamnose 3,5-epimerase [Legionella micdadei]
MKLTQTDIPDIVVVEPTVFEDERGWFLESFNEKRFCSELKRLNLATPTQFVQDNHSFSRKGVLRGLHYQLPPYTQGKLVRVIQGAVYDVVVDIREGSPTLGRWVGHELSASNKKMVWIPPGFAHGFLALEDDTHFLYKTTDFYHKESEGCLRWNDPSLGINWPSLTEGIILNAKDANAPCMDNIAKLPYRKGAKISGLIDIEVIGDSRGSLIVMEQGSNIPFNLKRAYYIFNTKADVSRGFHAHKNLQQLAVCVAGRCRLVLDDGTNRQEFWLDSPTKGLPIESMVWREMHDFSPDCVLAVFASEEYNESDYIRSYQEFKNRVNQ